MKESEIRPQEIFNRYLELTRRDGERLERSRFVEVPCPACASTDFALKFTKNGFRFVNCRACNSLYCSPRPTDAQLMDFYERSESSRYWSEVFFPSVAEIRREKLFRKKAEKLHSLLQAKGLQPSRICDVGAGYGIFLEELRKLHPGASYYAVEPDPKLAKQCESKGFETLIEPAQNARAWNGRFDLVISSEVIEHVFSPREFIRSLFDLTCPGGFALITGLGYEGFDILTLQENSQGVSAPHHLNFMSVRGFETLFKGMGFQSAEVTTPGQLDADIVLNSEFCPEFLKVLKTRGESAIQEFQRFLVENRLSSHTWVLARKSE